MPNPMYHTNPLFLEGSPYRADGSIITASPVNYSSPNYESSKRSYEQFASSSIRANCTGSYS